MKKALILFVASTLSAAAFAKSIVPTEQERISYIKKAQVWFSPNWIGSDFRFSSALDLADGPLLKKDEIRLRNDSIDCQYKVDDDKGTGMTRKFKCDMQTGDADKPTIEIKVKYRVSNAEIYSELISTRLFWALGFGADRMYFMREVNCFGCSDDPFEKPAVDTSSLTAPRSFIPTAIERKFKGATIDKAKKSTGWNFAELLNQLSDDPVVRSEQYAQRSALALLASFVNHVDNKDVNQRLVCLGGATEAGKCEGETAMIVQDLGATFGGGFDLGLFDLARVDLKKWSKAKIWNSADKCIAGVTPWISQSFAKVNISEAGREFLVKLLKGFSDGPAGRARVEQLFRSAHTEYINSASPAEWADVFMRKLHELEFPMGDNQPDFRCPR